MIAAFELLTIILGGMAAIGAFSISLYFSRSESGIGRAVAFDKAAEGVNMLVIFIFAVFYWFDLFVQMPKAFAVSLRLFAITSTIFSTIHLGIQTRNILKRDK